MKKRLRSGSRGAPSSYQQLEPRNLLATIVVNTVADTAPGISDGLVSLREAIVAANTDTAIDDAPAGSGDDIIRFSQSISGQTIELSLGEMNIVDGVTIRAGNAEIEIDAQTQSRIFSINSSSPVLLHGLRFTNGLSADGGGAIRIEGDSSVRIVDSTLEDNRAISGNGGAIHKAAGLLKIENSTFTNNQVDETSGLGGGIYSASETTRIDDSTFTRHRASAGGAVYSADGLLISKDNLYGDLDDDSLSNRASEKGGAIHSVATNSVGDIFANNRAAAGAAIAVESGRLTVAQGSFQRNDLFNNFDVENRGGAIEALESNVDLIESEFDLNTASGGQGGAIYSHEGQLTIAYSNLSRNSLATIGGAIAKEGGTLEVEWTNFIRNIAFTAGGGIGLLNVTDATINRSNFGSEDPETGNIAGQDSGPRELAGGSIYAAWSSLLITSSGFQHSVAQASRGGAIAVEQGEITIRSTGILDSRIEYRDFDDVRDGEGGGIYALNTTFNMDNSRVERNTVRADSSGFPGSRSGGGIVLENSESRILKTSVWNNEADDLGGGLLVKGGRLSSPTELSVINNAATRGGGVYIADVPDGSIHTFENSVVRRNSAEYGAGMFFNRANVSLNGGALIDNSASKNGGGIYNSSGSFLRGFDNVEFRGNMATFAGGAIANLGSVVIADSRLRQNEARIGGALYSANSDLLQFTEVTFQSNVASRSGGAIYLNDSSFYAGASFFVENEVTGMASPLTAGGGAISIVDSGSVTLANTQFLRNSAFRAGGAILARNSSFSITADSRFEGNVASATGIENVGGGAIRFESDDNESSLRIFNTTFLSNSSSGDGGALWSSGISSRITESVFDVNETSLRGGAAFFDRGINVFLDSAITNNTATVSAGGVFSSPAADTQFVRTTIEGNSP